MYTYVWNVYTSFKQSFSSQTHDVYFWDLSAEVIVNSFLGKRHLWGIIFNYIKKMLQV